MASSIKPLVKAFVAAKLEYDVLIKQEQYYKSEEGRAKSPVAKANKSYLTKRSSLLSKMSTFNTILVSELVPDLLPSMPGSEWYLISCMCGDNRDAVLIPLTQGISSIYRDLRVERDWRVTDLLSHITAVEGAGVVEAYQYHVAVLASKDLQQKGVIVRDDVDYIEEIKEGESTIEDNQKESGEPDSTEVAIRTSFHAEQRWVQRTKGISSELKAVEYRNKNLDEVRMEILAGFNSSQYLWTAEDKVEYWFDDNNMMYVYDPNTQCIITVYESDFSFSKEINRQIVFEQIKVLTKAWGDLVDTREAHKECEEFIEDAIYCLDAKIKSLNAELELLNAKKQAKLAELAESSKVLSLSAATYNVEFNKLFRFTRVSWGDGE